MEKDITKRLHQLDELLQEFESIVLHIDAEKANQKTAGGGWSPLEIVEHLKAAELGSLLYLEKKKDDFGNAASTGFGTYYRYGLLWLALSSPFKFKAPKSLAEPSGPYVAAVLLNDWRNIRSKLYTFLENYGTMAKGKDVFKHPRAGKMNFNLMLSFMVVHAKRHLAQLKRNI